MRAALSIVAATLTVHCASSDGRDGEIDLERPPNITSTNEMALAPEGRAAHGAVWTGREMIVFGGEGDGGPLASPRAYDPTLDRWRTLPDGPLSPRRYPVMAWTGREVIVYGGVGFVDGARFDPATGTWAMLPTSPLSRRALPAYAYAERTHELVIFGGEGDDGPVADGAAYDTVQGRFRSIASPPFGARSFQRAAFMGRELFVVSGLSKSGELASDAATYDPATDRWTTIALPVAARANADVFATEGGAVFFGGQRASGDDGCPDALDDGAMFDATTHALRLLPALGRPRAGSTVFYARGKLHVLFGYRCDEVLGDAMQLDVATGVWSRIDEVLPARHGATAIWTGERAIVFGGVGADGRARRDGALLTP